MFSGLRLATTTVVDPTQSYSDLVEVLVPQRWVLQAHPVFQIQAVSSRIQHPFKFNKRFLSEASEAAVVNQADGVPVLGSLHLSEIIK